ncbi:hypothetical protein EON68_04420 [archaeon]|nr:MAG: hypothetical protein EON68_04420 [archaeon]
MQPSAMPARASSCPPLRSHDAVLCEERTPSLLTPAMRSFALHPHARAVCLPPLLPLHSPLYYYRSALCEHFMGVLYTCPSPSAAAAARLSCHAMHAPLLAREPAAAARVLSCSPAQRRARIVHEHGTTCCAAAV